LEEIFAVLPESIRTIVMQIPPADLAKIEEIRIRIHRPLEVIADGQSYQWHSKKHNYKVEAKDGIQLLNKLSHYSLYALEEELKRGFITIRGGHRVGLAGKVITEKGQVKAIRDISSFNIRIAKEKLGISEPLIPYLYDEKWLNTLIIGSPQTGKTTLLRDLARLMSMGVPNKHIPSVKVGIVDERSEIAGCVKGVPQHHLGDRIDVLDACPKAEGMMMMIRSLSPDVIIVDEIGRKEDSEAIIEAMNAGVKMAMTVHGSSVDELLRRPTIKPLIEMGLFERYIFLSRKDGPGTIHAIKDSNQKLLALERRVT
jgi:stage III sporulation protein AA